MNSNPGLLDSKSEDRPATLEDLGAVVQIIYSLLRRSETRILMNISDGTAKLVALGNQLEKAQGEITAEIQKLTDATKNVDLPDDAVAAIDRLGAIAQGLDDINPDVPTPTPTPGGTGDPTTTSAAFRQASAAAPKR